MFLFKVEDIFSITGCGLVLVPGLGTNQGRVNSGMPIKLRRPDQTELQTVIAGIVFQTRDIALLPSITKEEVPIGTEVWLEQEIK